MTSYMANVYAALVKSGSKTIKEVPEKIRSEVQEILAADA